MTRVKQLCGFLLGLFLFNQLAFAMPIPHIEGYWKTIDDKSHKPRSIVHIFEDQGKYKGKIIVTYLEPGEHYTDVCKACSGKLKNQRILGMIFMTGLEQEGPASWGGGHIIDPKNGHRYRCKATLSDDGKSLNVRGYLGISLFGRSQTWLRVDKPNASEIPKV